MLRADLPMNGRGANTMDDELDELRRFTCQVTIEPMTPCWVTEEGPFILLCDACHGLVTGADTAG
jgi:hypothetical protein